MMVTIEEDGFNHSVVFDRGHDFVDMLNEMFEKMEQDRDS